MPQPQQPLDDFRYQDGAHADHEHFARFNAGQMTETEATHLFHHLDECPACSLRFRAWIGAADTEKPGPSM